MCIRFVTIHAVRQILCSKSQTVMAVGEEITLYAMKEHVILACYVKKAFFFCTVNCYSDVHLLVLTQYSSPCSKCVDLKDFSLSDSNLTCLELGLCSEGKILKLLHLISEQGRFRTLWLVFIFTFLILVMENLFVSTHFLSYLPAAGQKSAGKILDYHNLILQSLRDILRICLIRFYAVDLGDLGRANDCSHAHMCCRVVVHLLTPSLAPVASRVITTELC